MFLQNFMDVDNLIQFCKTKYYNWKYGSGSKIHNIKYSLRKIKIRTKKTSIYHLIKLAKLPYLTTNSAGRSVRKQAVGNSKWYNP